MKKLFIFIFFAAMQIIVSAQDTLTKTRFVIGLSAPELFHAGINVNICKSSQVGISAGIGPSWGEVWPTLNIEHRLYFGKIAASSGRKQWFFKLGGTYFPSGENQSAVSFTVGADLKSKAARRGWTIDAGGFILFQNYQDKSNQFYPALRFQHYHYFKKSKKHRHGSV